MLACLILCLAGSWSMMFIILGSGIRSWCWSQDTCQNQLVGGVASGGGAFLVTVSDPDRPSKGLPPTGNLAGSYTSYSQ
jgi:hypothetical protein